MIFTPVKIQTTVPEDEGPRRAVSEHLGRREGDFPHLHLLATSF